MPRFDVSALGEVMLRLSVPAGERLERARQLAVHPGGAEANVMSALACLGRRCAWSSGLPRHATGRLIENHMRMAGIDTSCVHWSAEGKVGLYFVEFADAPRNVDVIYDRAASCAARLTPDDVDWARLMDTRHFHISGITPALSPAGQAVAQTALEAARAHGATTSFDVNYRAKMWSPATARQVMEPMLADIDVLFCGQGDAETVFDLRGTTETILDRLGNLAPRAVVVMTRGDEGIYLRTREEVRFEPARPVTITDRLGAGDAMAAGFLHGYLEHDLTMGLRYGALLAAMVLTQHGDMLISTPGEIESLMESGGGGLTR